MIIKINIYAFLFKQRLMLISTRIYLLSTCQKRKSEIGHTNGFNCHNLKIIELYNYLCKTSIMIDAKLYRIVQLFTKNFYDHRNKSHTGEFDCHNLKITELTKLL